jgi:pantothenate kinase
MDVGNTKTHIDIKIGAIKIKKVKATNEHMSVAEITVKTITLTMISLVNVLTDLT